MRGKESPGSPGVKRQAAEARDSPAHPHASSNLSQIL
jgi:hypothetical protein